MPFAKVTKIFRPSFIRCGKPPIALVVWLAALGTGSWWITAYQFRSEQLSPESYVRYWPTQTAIVPADRAPTMILFLHPKCPCSRASLTQLERLLADVQARGAALPKSYVVAPLPESGFDDWTDSENLQRAAKLPGATIVIDRGGIEAARFGATTSGTIMLFDATLKRRYAGGITPARGLEGSNVGCDALLALLQGGEINVPNIPAFGCRLCLPRATQSVTKCITGMCPTKANP